MSEDIQGLLEKINRDGIEKANAEAAKIIAEAKAKAAALLNDARAGAQAAKDEAEKASADYATRAEETIRQSARDTILKIEASVTTLLEKLLAKDVDKALADEATASSIAAEAIKGLTGSVEIACSAKLAAALKSQLAAQKNVTVVLDDTLGSGFTVKLDGGRIEHSFTGEVIAAELARRLRPDLAKLVK